MNVLLERSLIDFENGQGDDEARLIIERGERLIDGERHCRIITTFLHGETELTSSLSPKDAARYASYASVIARTLADFDRAGCRGFRSLRDLARWTRAAVAEAKQAKRTTRKLLRQRLQ